VLLTAFRERVRGRSFPYLPEWAAQHQIPQAIINRMRISDDVNLLIEILKFMTVLTAEHNEYSADLMAAGAGGFLAGVQQDVRSVDCSCAVFACVANMAASSPLHRDAFIELFPPGALVAAARPHPQVMSEILHVCYAFSGWPFASPVAFENIANALLAILRLGLPKRAHQVFLWTCSNLADCHTFDRILNVPEISDVLRSVLFSILDPSILKPVLWTLSFIFERNRIAGLEIVQRLLFLITFHDDVHIVALACDTVAVMLRVSGDMINVACRCAIEKVLFAAADGRPILVRKAAFNALSIFAYVYPEYVPLLIEHDLLRVLREMLDVDDWMMQTQALLLLDCVFGNESAERRSESRNRFSELDGMSVVEDLLESSIPRLAERAAAFLLAWNAVLIDVNDES
jgi:hypothetical protein